jgi:hypothetical protein
MILTSRDQRIDSTLEILDRGLLAGQYIRRQKYMAMSFAQTFSAKHLWYRLHQLFWILNRFWGRKVPVFHLEMTSNFGLERLANVVGSVEKDGFSATAQMSSTYDFRSNHSPLPNHFGQHLL